MKPNRTYENEQFYIFASVAKLMSEMSVTDVATPKDAMLHLRMDWEELQSCLYNRKIDGFEPAVSCMMRLASTSMMMAAELQARIKNEREKQMGLEEEEVEPSLSPVVPPKRTKRKITKKKLTS